MGAIVARLASMLTG